MAKKKQAVLQVTARPDKFRRAGFTFTREVTTLVLKDLKKEQIAALKEEPNLVVIETEVEAESEGSE